MAAIAEKVKEGQQHDFFSCAWERLVDAAVR